MVQLLEAVFLILLFYQPSGKMILLPLPEIIRIFYWN